MQQDTYLVTLTGGAVLLGLMGRGGVSSRGEGRGGGRRRSSRQLGLLTGLKCRQTSQTLRGQSSSGMADMIRRYLLVGAAHAIFDLFGFLEGF